MDLDLTGKVVLVTGGANGIGAGIVRAVAREGGVPVVLDRDVEAGADLIRALGVGQIISIELMDEDSLEAAVAEARSSQGRIDAVVNNAGSNDFVGLGQSPTAFRQSLEKSLIHVFTVVHHALPALRESGGSILNISSKVATTGQGGTSGYAASKGGMNGLTREWALDLAEDGIRVNAICPAEVWTPMYERQLAAGEDPAGTKAAIEALIPLGQRFTAVEEVADLAAFLLSPKAGHITGQILYPDGGYTHLDRKATG